MKILYKQPKNTETVLDSLGIRNCFCKYLTAGKDHNVIRKEHYHTDYEIHMVETGSAVYDTQGQHRNLQTGDFLLIPPGKRHRAVEYERETTTFALTFSAELLPELPDCVSGSLPQRLRENLGQIHGEAAQSKTLSDRLIEGNILETVVLLWRLCGMKETQAPERETGEDARVAIARQYISDNIVQFPAVQDVAVYCHLSVRQLSRLFERDVGISLAEFIQLQRVRYAQELLRGNELSLRQISEHLNFSSECYFSSFFKKHAGMTPGKYRQMYTNKQGSQ